MVLLHHKLIATVENVTVENSILHQLHLLLASSAAVELSLG